MDYCECCKKDITDTDLLYYLPSGSDDEDIPVCKECYRKSLED
jgi:hypothetical protein